MIRIKGVGRNIFGEGGVQRKRKPKNSNRRPKNSKKDRKIALLSLFQGGWEGATEKRPKHSKKDQKNTMYENQIPGRARPFPLLPTPMIIITVLD